MQETFSLQEKMQKKKLSKIFLITKAKGVIHLIKNLSGLSLITEF